MDNDRDELQAQLEAVWPEGQPITLAMLDVELKLFNESESPMAPERRLDVQIELRQLPGEKAPEYRARVKLEPGDWQDWQPALPAIGAQALLDL